MTEGLKSRTVLHLGLRRSSLRRLEAGIEGARLDFDSRAARDPSHAIQWKPSTDKALSQAELCLQRKDIEGGWSALHAATRFAVAGFDTEELQNQRIQLLNETPKLTPWRGDSIQQILGEHPSKATSRNVADAMAIRDDFSATQYHKIWMTGDQVKLLLVICFVVSALYFAVIGWIGPYVFSGFEASGGWGYRTLSSVLILGLLGAALSALRGLMRVDKAAKIPERVANHFTTIARLLSGVIAGLAGYIFWIEGLIPLSKDQLHPTYSIPLIFGFVGERMVMHVSSSLTATASNEK